MNAESDTASLLQSMLDGTLDHDAEQAVLSLLARDDAARLEFARLAQLHAWLATDERTRLALSAPVRGARRRRFSRPAWWLAAAVAAALLVFSASKIWPLPGSQVVAGGPSMRGILTAACSRCHGDPDELITGRTATGLAFVIPGQPDQSPLYVRLVGDNACARSLSAAERALLRAWIAGARDVTEAS